MIHLTYTGPEAGAYLCLRYIARIGQPTVGERLPQDKAVHAAYAPEATLASPDLCPDCKHVFDCAGTAGCERCTRLGYTD
jgi:hypothetical protein